MMSAREYERALVACAFHDAAAREFLASEPLPSDLLGDLRLREILAAVLKLNAEGGEAIDELAGGGQLDPLAVLTRVSPEWRSGEEPITVADLLTLDVDLPDPSQVAKYLTETRRAWTRRRVADLAGQAQFRIRAADADPLAVLSDLQSSLRAVEDASLHAESDGMDAAFDRARAALYRTSDDLIGLSTGWADLDDKTCGLEPGRYYFFAGRPSMGKSVAAVNVAAHNAMRGKSVGVFSLEMGTVQYLHRIVSDVENVSLKSIRKGWPLTRDERERCEARLYEIQRSWPLVVFDRAAATVADITARCRRMRRERGLDLVVVDYIQLVGGEGETKDRVAAVSIGLKRLAKELDVPVVVAAQFNREPTKRNGTNFRPRLEDLGESGQLERDADCVIAIHRDEVYHETPENRGMAEFIILKQRDGEVGTVDMLFDGEHQRFRCPAPSSFNDYAGGREFVA